MKTYLLLRNNRQSGPFTLSEILMEGLKPHDLVWVEGHSASWRYPSELAELKAHVPSPVLEAQLDLGFSEVQNRVVPHRPGQRPLETMAAPLVNLGASTGIVQSPSKTDPFPSIPVHMALSERSMPAFDALAGLLTEDDLMPTMARQSGPDSMLPGRSSEIQDISTAALPVPKPAQMPSEAEPPKIKVVLPAAMADKTMVVIRRRDPAGRPVPEPRTSARRPVLEFIPEDSETGIGPLSASSPVETIAGTLESISAEPVISLSDADANNKQPDAKTAQVADGMVSGPAMEKVEAAAGTENAAMAEERKVVDQLSRVSENVAAAGDPSLEDAEAIHHLKTSPALRVNISLVQKIAIVTAIVSLIAVAILIVNSIFNPDAYEYGKKPASRSTGQSSPPAAQGSEKP
jgi:hypothetical protein